MLENSTFEHYVNIVSSKTSDTYIKPEEAYGNLIKIYNDRPTFLELLFIAEVNARSSKVKKVMLEAITLEIQNQVECKGEEYIRSRAEEMGMVEAQEVEAPPMLPPTDRDEEEDTAPRALKERIPEMLEALEEYTGVVPPIDSTDGRKAIASLFSSLTGGKVETIARYLKSVYDQSTD